MVMYKSMIFYTLFCLSNLSPLVSSLSFDFPSFNQSTENIVVQGDAYLSTGIQLSKNQLDGTIAGSNGRALYGDPLLLWDADTKELTDFATHFAFVIDPLNQTSSGDGMAFFLSPYPSPNPNTGGHSLDLFNDAFPANSTINNKVAVEFDTFRNTFDPSDNHIGIDVNSFISVANVTCTSSFKNASRTNYAWVSYNASTHNLSILLTHSDDPLLGADSCTLNYTIDLRDHLPDTVAVGFSASTGKGNETHTLLSWSFNSSLQPKSMAPIAPVAPLAPTGPHEGQPKSKTGLVVGSVIGAGVLVILLGLLWFTLWRRKRPRRNAEEDEEDFDFDQTIDDEFERERGPKRFPYQELANATRDFSEEGKLGEGGFGSVYKGYLKDLKLEVAIKRVSKGSKQGRKEYIAEVKIISRLRHRNLVQLVGWCHDRRELLLVYEFLPNGSLDSYIYNPTKHLEWPVRHDIVLGLASALLYLHQEWGQCVLHRDVKPSNVMLDSAFNAKLGDFGLARLVDHGRGLQTTALAGTIGYLAPECFTTGKASKESDVYSFGVVALEIACGRRPVELLMEQASKVRLVEWVWELYGKRTILEAVDEKLNGNFEQEQMERLMVVGLWCAHPDYSERPSMKQAISALNLETALPELPPKMPVPMYRMPSADTTQSSHISSVATSTSTTTGYATNDTSNSSMSPSSSASMHLLKQHMTDTN